MKRKAALIVLYIMFVLISLYSIKSIKSINFLASNKINIPFVSPSNYPTFIPTPTVIESPKPTPTSTPKPLTFSETNTLYGPCVRLPVLMYHHIQSREDSAKLHQNALTVYIDVFNAQMQYLKGKGYNTISPDALISFFNTEQAIPAKSVLLTFDDAYSDFFTNAYPVLNSVGFKGIVFTPTGLLNNSGYLSWDQITQMNGSQIYFANHTWSHKNVAVEPYLMQKEILTADTQLKEKGLDSSKVFAYPYGLMTQPAKAYLSSLGYQLAFTTQPGNTQCKGKRLELPRVRIGNSSLSSYGF